jgi:endonuclease YncB( thermonuclease family)
MSPIALAILTIVVPLTVIRVVDGDTFVAVGANGAVKTIRVLGYDAFETRKDKRLHRQAVASGISDSSALQRGLQCKKLVASIIDGKNVNVYVKKVEYYRRELAIVYVGAVQLKDLIPDSLKSKSIR